MRGTSVVTNGLRRSRWIVGVTGSLVLLFALSMELPRASAEAEGRGPDTEALVRTFTEYDNGYRKGLGNSESSISSSLGWGESGFLQNYVRMYRVTRDERWLEKIVDHFGRMIANMADHDGDGIPGWQTDRYSVSRMAAWPLHNQGKASIEPQRARVTNIKRAHKAVDGMFSFERVGPDGYRLVRLSDRKVLFEGPYVPGTVIQGLPGFEVRVEGEPEVGDKFVVETHAVRPLEYGVHEGMIIYPVAQFIEIVRKDPKLDARFGQAATKYLKVIEERILNKQERYWLETSSGEGAYRMTDSTSERYPNRILPHNQYLALGRAYLVLKDVSDNPLYLERATQMARYFKRFLRQDENAYVWNYWDWPEGGEMKNSRAEDTSHGRIDIEFVVEARRRNVVFSDGDLVRFANTFTKRMWNGSLDSPRIGDRVNRKKGDARTFAGWIELSQWDPQILEIYQAIFRNGDNQPVTAIPGILVARQVLDTSNR